MRMFIFLLVTLLLFSCKSPQPVSQVPIVEREKIVERLVPVAVPADSTAIFALFECDSLNNVIMKQLAEHKSKGVESDFSFNDGRFNYNAKTKPDTVYIPVADSVKYKEIPVEVVRTVKVNELTRWQTIRMHIGDATIAILGFALVFFIIKQILKWRKKLPL